MKNMVDTFKKSTKLIFYRTKNLFIKSERP